MLTSDLPEDKLVKEKVAIFFPNQNAKKGELSGAHVNISGGGVLKSSKQVQNAQKLLEFLSDTHAQEIYAAVNKEFPVNPSVKADPVLAAWGSFKEDNTNLSVWGPRSKEATRIADKAGWK
ncbi:Iron deficiency-induced protein A precursor [compost metagenome]